MNEHFKISTLSKANEKLKEKTDETFTLIWAEYRKLNLFLQNQKEDFYLKVANRLIEKCINLYFSIYSLLKEHNLYSAKIIYRSLIEHYLKSQYIILNPEKEEDISSKYILYGHIEEYIAKIKSKNVYNSLIGENNILLWEEIKREFPEVSSLSKNQIETEIQKFNIKQICRKLATYIKGHTINLNHFENILKNYWECSMFVHGGPGTEFHIPNSREIYSEEEALDLLNMISIPYFLIFQTIQLIFINSALKYNFKGSAARILNNELEKMSISIEDQLEYLRLLDKNSQ
ncbi:hypothetical protein EHQ46_06010 [Leptospira yanagawae]|uniref:Uncharacterized protein n=1 Tax=Leptospira yanagawae TaxID=293069 RepID=A0ABY2M3I2_9LEPT|nr:DUF5677 domain-containing protein [Leptospira yanagawae]TGL23069.1 hypothetical protein EHQ46_06010 [Leptospira yanagawae]